MARQDISIGTAPSGVGGDTTRTAAIKINAMTQELYARDALLGTASNRNVGLLSGNVQEIAAPAPIVGNSAFAEQGSHFQNYGDNTTVAPPGGAYWAGIRAQYPFQNCAMDLMAQVVTGGSMNLMFRTVAGNGGGDPWRKIYHDGNTTRGSGGALSAASPIVRIANIADSARLDLQESTFEPAGDWGVANDQAEGVFVERLAVGEYRITGSLGLALEGWRTHDPSSPDGGRMLGITDSQQADDGSVVIKLFKQRWTLTEDGEMVPGRGAPMDVPLNSWIDVRLEMPQPEAQPPINTEE